MASPQNHHCCRVVFNSSSESACNKLKCTPWRDALTTPRYYASAAANATVPHVLLCSQVQGQSTRKSQYQQKEAGNTETQSMCALLAALVTIINCLSYNANKSHFCTSYILLIYRANDQYIFSSNRRRNKI